MLGSLDYEPLATVPPTQAPRNRPTLARIACPRCGKTFCASAIVDAPEGPQEYEDRPGELQLYRRLYCDHCDRVIAWYELCDPSGGGRLTGLPVGATLRYGGRAVAAFLAAYPQAAGVEQA